MYNYNLMTTQYLNDANTQLRGIDVDVAYLLQQDFSQEGRKIILADILGRLDAIEADCVKVKEIDRSERAQAALADLDEHLAMVRGKVKATENLGNSPEEKIDMFESLSAAGVIANDIAVLTPDNVLQGKNHVAGDFQYPGRGSDMGLLQQPFGSLFASGAQMCFGQAG